MNLEKTILKKNYEFSQKFVKYFPQWLRPNHLTILRLILIFPVVWLFLNEYYVYFLILFVVAYVTDFIDGALARARNQKTAFGVYVDPIADKLLFFIALFLIAYGKISYTLFFTLLIIEITLVVLSWIYTPIATWLKLKFTFSSNLAGKTKALCQILAIIVLTFYLFWNQTIILSLGEALLWSSLFFLALGFMQRVFIEARK